MANRFPLIVDSTDSNIKELPSGDSLDFTSVGVANLANLSLSGGLTTASIGATNITVSGNFVGNTMALSGSLLGADADFSGTVDANTYTVNGAALSTIQVKSDWNESNPSDPSFIQNKPVIGGVTNLNDLGDVFAASPSSGDIIEYDGFSWQSKANSGGGGVDLTAFSVITNGASGNGSLSYNNGTGVFTFTPALVPTSTSQLTNDSNFITLTSVTNLGYITRTGISAGAPIAYNSTTGVLTFDNSATNYTTLAEVLVNVDLTDILTAGAVSTLTASFGKVIATGTGTNGEFGTLQATSIDLGASGMSSTNGGIALTNGNLTMTSGNLTLTNGDVSADEVFGTTRVNTAEILSSADINLKANGGSNRVTADNYLRVMPSSSRPSTPLNGDIHVTSDYMEVYSANADGQSTAGWLQMPCANGERGLQVPYFTTTQRNAIPSPRPGELILNTTTNQLQVRGTSGWVDLGS
jgi:hypothetical protein